jgi:(p)ppGpp synthase/HD superfamily hydrolase
MKIVCKAIEFANKAHAGQVRKYTSQPYIFHPMRVAMAVANFKFSDEMVCAAILHDVVEDCGVAPATILGEFGPDIYSLVDELTNKTKASDLPRAERKRMDRERIVTISLQAKIIKALDRIDNLREMRDAPADFKKKYFQESRELIAVLRGIPEEIETQLASLCMEIE